MSPSFSKGWLATGGVLFPKTSCYAFNVRHFSYCERRNATMRQCDNADLVQMPKGSRATSIRLGGSSTGPHCTGTYAFSSVHAESCRYSIAGKVCLYWNLISPICRCLELYFFPNVQTDSIVIRKSLTSSFKGVIGHSIPSHRKARLLCDYRPEWTWIRLGVYQ